MVDHTQDRVGNAVLHMFIIKHSGPLLSGP